MLATLPRTLGADVKKRLAIASLGAAHHMPETDFQKTTTTCKVSRASVASSPGPLSPSFFNVECSWAIEDLGTRLEQMCYPDK